MRLFVAGLTGALAVTLAAPALAGTTDCLWEALPPARDALITRDPGKQLRDWKSAAAGRLPALALEESAFRCGSKSAVMDAFAVTMIEKRSDRLRAERALTRYQPAELAGAFDWPTVRSAVEAYWLDSENNLAMNQAKAAFERRLPRPPTPADTPLLAVWFASLGQERLAEDMWQSLANDGPAVEPEPMPPDAELRRLQALEALLARPAWEQGDLSACVWSKLAASNQTLLYVYPLNTFIALGDQPAYGIARAFLGCGGTPTKATVDDLGNYIGVRAAERGLLGRFEPVGLDSVYSSLTPAEQVEQITMKGGLQTASAGLKRFRTLLGLAPNTDLNHGSPEDASVDTYFLARSMLAHGRRAR